MTKEGPQRMHSQEHDSASESARQKMPATRPTLLCSLGDPAEQEMIADWAARVGLFARIEKTWDWALPACIPGTVVLLDGALVPDPIQVCRQLRGRGLLMVFVVSPGAPWDALQLFRAGAVDFVRRPYLADDLFARVLRLLPNCRPESGSRADWTPTSAVLRLSVDRRGCQLSTSTRSIYLRPSEYALFEYLARATPRFVEHTELASNVLRTHGSGGSVRTQVYELRRKLSSIDLPDVIETLKGKGAYRLRPDVYVDFESDHVLPPRILTKI